MCRVMLLSKVKGGKEVIPTIYYSYVLIAILAVGHISSSIPTLKISDGIGNRLFRFFKLKNLKGRLPQG